MPAPSAFAPARSIDLPQLWTRAAVQSVNGQARTVSVVFSTGAPVDRIDSAGRRYREVLSLKPGHVRLERLNAGAPLLNSHQAFSISDVIGTVEPGSARLEAGRGVATVRFSKRDDVEPIWGDVRDGIVCNVSVGYRVHTFEEDATRNGEIPTRTAVDWEPFELSLVSMPADVGAKVRGANAGLRPCRIVSRNCAPASEDADRARRLRLAQAAAPSTSKYALPEVHPSSREFAILCRAVRAVSAQGVAIPPGAYHVRWFDAWDYEEALGFVDREQPIGLWLQRGLDERKLFKTIAHELWHVRDIVHLGRDAFHAMSEAEREARAEGFSFSCTFTEYGDLWQIGA